MDPTPEPPGSPEAAAAPEASPGALTALWARWLGVPLYLRILGALMVGVVTGLALGPRAAWLELPAKLIIRVLGAIAPPLILLAVVQALMKARVGGRTALRMAYLLALNTLVAIGIGLLVANTIKPGTRVPKSMVRPAAPASQPSESLKSNPFSQILDQVPDSLLRPLVDNNVIGVILVAVAFGVALRHHHRSPAFHTARELIDLAFECIVTVLHWVIALVPLAVFGIVAATVGVRGFGPFVALGAFVVAVVIGLALQATWYLVRIRLGSWVRPLNLIRGTRDALTMAFSTDSSSATMPVTYACLKDKVGLREQSASLGALVGTNFNNDGTALYEAMSALFIAQLIGQDLPLGHQLVIVVMSIIASVGAAGIPEAGTVTMLLVLNAVRLPTNLIPLLLTVDWFLDRCRTTVNVMGDMNVSCLLDGKEPPTNRPPTPQPDDSLVAASPAG